MNRRVRSRSASNQSRSRIMRRTVARTVIFSELIASRGVIPGIRSDGGKEEHPNWDPQTMTRGLKGLGKQLDEWTERSKGTLGFTKWRQVILVEPDPSKAFIDYAMHVMA